MITGELIKLRTLPSDQYKLLFHNFVENLLFTVRVLT